MRVEIHVTAGPAKGKHFRFDKADTFLFGRASEAQISLPQDRYVSRRHFLLEIAPPDCKLTDLDSKNGVIVNGIRYGGQKPSKQDVRQAPNGQKQVFLKSGDQIVVGDTKIKVFIYHPAAPQHSVTETNLQHKPVHCHRCGKEIPLDVVGKHGAATDHNTCADCREKQHREELRKILTSASAQASGKPATKTSSETTAIPGYHIEDEVKHAGPGKMYKAVHLESRELVMVKVLSPQSSPDPYIMKAFHRELSIIKQLNHPHIVRFFEHGEIEDTYYMIFEFVDGPNLAQFLKAKGGRLSLDDAAPLWLDMLDGLAYAHRAPLLFESAEGTHKTAHGIVHRNLKPHNILLASQERTWIPKITDFGLAKNFESAGFTDITIPGDVLGTPVYWPREQITQYKYLHPATDVFSMAAVFYEMLTGTWIREGFHTLFRKCKQLGRLPSISDYMRLFANNPPIPLRQRDPSIPEPVARVIDKALGEREVPQDVDQMHAILQALRYPDAENFRAALVKAFEQIGLPVAITSRAHQYEDNVNSEDVPSPSADAIMYSVINQSGQQDVALFLLDIVESTNYVIHQGDTDFSTLMGSIYRQIRKHQATSKLMVLKSTGDGFLAVFRTAKAAFAVAKAYLEQPLQSRVRLRMALHWGTVKTSPDGNVLGTEVRRVFRLENIAPEDRVAPPPADVKTFPVTNRLLATTPFIERLDAKSKQQFHSIGKFRLSPAGKAYYEILAWQP